MSTMIKPDEFEAWHDGEYISGTKFLELYELVPEFCNIEVNWCGKLVINPSQFGGYKRVTILLSAWRDLRDQ